MTDGGIFHGLAGVSVPKARLTLVVNDEMSSTLSLDKSSIAKLTEIEANDKKPAAKQKKRREKGGTDNRTGGTSANDAPRCLWPRSLATISLCG